MQNANLSQEVSSLYKDLADSILAEDGKEASRIYHELLRAGQSLEMLAARVPAIRGTPELEPFGPEAAAEQASTIPDAPSLPPNAERHLVRGSTIERAAERLDWTIAFGLRRNNPRDLEGEPQPDPPRVARAPRLRFGHAGPTGLSLASRLGLAGVLIAAAAGAGIFLLTHSAGEKVTAQGVAAEKAPAKVLQDTSSIGGPAVAPRTAGAAQSAPLAEPAPTAPSPSAAEFEAKPALGSPSSVALPDGPAPSAATTPSTKPESKVALTAPTVEATGASPVPRKPPTEPAFSAAEIAGLVARGDWLLATGEVDSARLVYERAAASGEARAAVRLGQTFDPVFLDQAHLRGARADSGMAVFWYRRARDLGAVGVASRLKSLEAK